MCVSCTASGVDLALPQAQPLPARSHVHACVLCVLEDTLKGSAAPLPFSLITTHCLCCDPQCRARLQQLAAQVDVASSADLAAEADAKRPVGQKTALAGVRMDAGVHANSLGSRPAQKTPGGWYHVLR